MEYEIKRAYDAYKHPGTRNLFNPNFKTPFINEVA